VNHIYKNKLKLNVKHLPLFLYIIIIPLLQLNFKFPCLPNTCILYVISRSNSDIMLDNLPETKDIKLINSYKCCRIKFCKQTAKLLYFTHNIFPLVHVQTIQFVAYLCTLFACSQHCRAVMKFAQSIHPSIPIHKHWILFAIFMKYWRILQNLLALQIFI
jgi:hypothetical protein